MKGNMAPIRNRASGKRESQSKLHLRRKLLLLVVALLAAVGMAAVAAPASQGLSGEAILDHLNAVIDWYRNTLTNAPTVGLPSDAMYALNARNMAAEVVQLAFDSAQAEAGLIPAASQASGAAETTSQSSLAKMQSDVAARIVELQAQIASLNQQIAGARKAKLQELTSERDRAQGELDLRNAMHDALGQMAKFISANSQSGKSGLEGSIDELRNSVPELSATGATGSAKTVAKPTTTTSTPTAVPTANGLIGEVVALYDQLQGLQQVSQLMQQTAAQPAAGDAAGHHPARPANGKRKQ
jgi:hypothetical protein